MLTPIATVEERLRIINECRQSGLTANEWCRQHGLRWIEKITVFNDHFTVEFKSGITIDIEV